MASGKKGNMDDMFIPVSLLIVAVVIFAGYMILNSSQSAFTGYGSSYNLITNGKTMFTRLGNVSFTFIAVALILFNIIGAFLLVTHPVFMIIDIILLPLSVMVSAAISNAYEGSLYTMTEASNFAIMNFTMLNLPLLIVVTSILSAVCAYALVKQ